MTQETTTRKIRLTTNVSLLLETPKEQDIVSAQAEALLITKMHKIVEMISTEGREISRRPRSPQLRFTDSEAKALIKEWKTATPEHKHKMADSIGVDYNKLSTKVSNLKSKYKKVK